MKTGLNFHNTFPPQTDYISRILQKADGRARDVELWSEELGIPTGASTGKVRPHLYYAALMGLIDEEMRARTPLGEIVLCEDPACAEELTQWLLHANLCGEGGAEMWNYVYRHLLPDNDFSVSDAFLKERMAERFGAKTRFAVIKSCYTKQLTAIDYVTDEGGRLSVNRRRPRREYLYLYAYDMLRQWDCLYPDSAEITEPAFRALRTDACFGFGSEELGDIADRLAAKGILRLNRQLTPYTVLRTAHTADILPKLYSLLL